MKIKMAKTQFNSRSYDFQKIMCGQNLSNNILTNKIYRK